MSEQTQALFQNLFNKLDKELARAELLDKIGVLVQEAIEVHGVTTDELKDLIFDAYERQFDDKTRDRI